MPKNIVFAEIEAEEAVDKAPIPATQQTTALSRFGGIRTFIPTNSDLGGTVPLSDLIGTTIALVGGSPTELASQAWRWEFRYENGETGAFLSSSPSLRSLEPKLQTQGAALLRVLGGPTWVDSEGRERPSYKFKPGE